MTTTDTALNEHLRELATLAREVGAGRCIVVRGAKEANLSLALPNIETQQHQSVTVGVSTNLPILAAGTVLIIEFAESDGHGQPVELL